MFWTNNQPGVGPYLAAGLPLIFSGMEKMAAGPAPILGQHTEEVLAEMLWVTQGLFGQMRDRRVV